MSDVATLQEIAASFDRPAALRKAELLAAIARRGHISGRDARLLGEALCFLRAYPDDARVLRLVGEVTSKLRGWLAGGAPDDSGLPNAVHSEVYTYPLLMRMSRGHRECFEIDWEGFEEQDALTNALGTLVTSSECQALDDIYRELHHWFAARRASREGSDLALLLELFANAPPAQRDVLFEQCDVPVRYELREEGTACCEIARPVDRVHYQRRPFQRENIALERVVHRAFAAPGRLSAAAGAALVDLGQRTLCARNLEIRTLSNANEGDAWLLPCGRGIQIGLLGVVPAYRDPLESHYCALVIKNGVPVAYGPASVSLGCCEIGLNLFPEFRGAEVRFLYPQLMRVLYHVLGAEYFFLTSYGMGEGNPAAIRTGAFWFYRKMGFRASSPEVEALAQEEETKMRARPGYRSSPAMLRRLSHTEAHLDLSGGSCSRLYHGAIGLRQTEWVARRFGAGLATAERACTRRLSRVLGTRPRTPGEERSWQMLAPLFCMIPDIGQWSVRERRGLLRIAREKGKPSEAGVDRMLRGHARLREALYELAAG